MSTNGHGGATPQPAVAGRRHVRALHRALRGLEREADRLDAWGARAATVLLGGGRLLAAGNGGSAAEAQHLTAELVGRYRDERVPLSAIALHADTSSLTAITNDYGPEEAFARQVRAHGRPGDICVLLSTSGRSSNVLAAAETAGRCRLVTWAVTGPRPNPLEQICDDALCIDAEAAATVQEAHLVVVHLLAAAIDAAVASISSTGGARTGRLGERLRSGA